MTDPDQDNGDQGRRRAIDAAVAWLTDGGYQRALAELVVVETESQNPARGDRVSSYLSDLIGPRLAAIGFDFEVSENPIIGGGPLLVAERHESADLPTVLTYGHADVVAGLDDDWSDGLNPWVLVERGDRLYGRGTADNKGQHLINLLALETVIAERDGRLGFNVKVLFETSEEIGSVGLREFVAAHRGALAADVMIASDGPRVAAELPTMVLGLRGAMTFTMSIDLRREAHHSGNWGGFIADPAIVLANAIAAISGPDGRINVPEWRPTELDPDLRAALDCCPFDAGTSGDQPDDWWGEPGLTVWEKTALWPSFTVLAIDHGRPDSPVNAVQPRSAAHCGLRYPASIDPDCILPALRRFLDDHGFGCVDIPDAPSAHMGATCGSPNSTWAGFVHDSIERSVGRPPQILPSNGGSLPNDVFTDIIGVDTIWVPHSYNSCSQHAPDEHLLRPVVHEALGLMAGIWWDLGNTDLTPPQEKSWT